MYRAEMNRATTSSLRIFGKPSEKYIWGHIAIVTASWGKGKENHLLHRYDKCFIWLAIITHITRKNA